MRTNNEILEEKNRKALETKEKKLKKIKEEKAKVKLTERGEKLVKRLRETPKDDRWYARYLDKKSN